MRIGATARSGDEDRGARGERSRVPAKSGAGPDRGAAAGAGSRAEPDRGAAAGAGSDGGRLFVVATPIGNLADVTLRALETLRAAPLVAAEDTRLSRRLLDRHGIAARLVSFHAANSAMRLPELLAHLRSGADLAVVTDAGTPGVSDPGDELVRAWLAEGGRVVPIPGPSAVLAALAATGIAGPRWTFEGFLPRSGRERRERLARIASDERGAVVFEGPNRVPATLADLAGLCGATRPGAVCRELTKLHEEVVVAGLGALAERAAAGGIALRGEFVLVVGAAIGTPAESVDDPAIGAASGRRAGGRTEAGPTRSGGSRPGSDAEELAAARSEVDRLVSEGVGRSEAARRIAAATGIPRRRLYGGEAELR